MTDGRIKRTYCFFSAQYLPTPGGVERYTFNLSKELIRRGHRVIVVTSAIPGLPERETDQNGIRILRVPTIPLCAGRLPIAVPSRKWKAACAELDQFGLSRIVIQTRLYTLSLMGMRYAVSRGIPFITIEHGTSYVGMQSRLIRKMARRYEDLLVRRAKKMGASFYTVSQAGADWLSHFGIRSKGVLYNSVDDTAILHAVKADRGSIRAKLNLPDDALLVAFVGRLIPEKGIRQLIGAVNSLHQRLPVYLAVAGDGILYAELARQRTSAVRFLGNLPQPEVMALLHQSNLFCLPSDSEGFPTSVLEAVLCHCYVITTPYGGAKELICSAKYGGILPDNTQEEIESALFHALTSPHECKEAAAHAFARFYEKFTWQKTGDALETISWGDAV